MTLISPLSLAVVPSRALREPLQPLWTDWMRSTSSAGRRHQRSKEIYPDVIVVRSLDELLSTEVDLVVVLPGSMG